MQLVRLRPISLVFTIFLSQNLWHRAESANPALVTPCAVSPGLASFYFDPSVFTPGNSINITQPSSSCPTCKNAYYYPGSTNQITRVTLAQTLTPGDTDWISVLTCPNFCCCGPTGVCYFSQTHNNFLGVKPFCDVNGCNVYLHVVQQGTTPGSFVSTDGQVISFFPNMNPNGINVYDALFHKPLLIITSCNCNGCDYAIDCITPVEAVTPAPALCFSADTKLRTKMGEIKRMDELKLHDWVLAANDSDIVYSPVESWIHRVPSQNAEFMHIGLENGRILKLTPKHFIYQIKCTGHQNVPLKLEEIRDRPVFAEVLSVGDCLYYLAVLRDDLVFVERRIRNISRVHSVGIYSPLTGTGNIVAEDVLVSCHTLLHSQTFYLDFLKQLQTLPVINWLFGLAGSTFDQIIQLPYGIDSLLHIFGEILPDQIFNSS